ncbi:trans-1,2-dihydrobenzene-1,2-diol dehydrogenase-like [Anopheles arabiensis]|uniref:Trans-1,2-dihydrobenzene-1,2-diol dehydrogenase n=2 Tax=gambiae species complex TaxID=44542 RepID=A0A6E8VZ04_ANOCL|nr:trans-1,2-dihydrobenzene-1,2-diol dehydrogenase-like [Anopheles arabiensis]XP_040237626.1 trans-1,2-dihydrobenzene-1,2-diol dehydrogenase-like [Anopheles coluzzii]
MAPLRWAIVSAGTISHDFACAVSTLPAADHQLVAVGARGLENARKFAELHGIPRFYEGYEAIAKDPEVDVVYVGTVNNAHYEVSRMMLEAGKHVLCEKPLCVNRGQARALLDFARERGRFCMEAIWSRFFPSYIHLRERIGRGDLGRIERVEVQFGFPLTHVERVRMKSLGGGTVLDLGVYTIQVAMWAFQAEPVKIEAAGQLNDEGVDVGITAKLHFPQGGVANIRTSAIDKLPNTAVIIGTKGSITLHDFWCPTELTDVDGTVRSYPLPTPKVECILQNSAGLRYEAEETRRRILAGELESPSVSHQDSLAIAGVQDAIRKQIGVEMPEDYIYKS